MDKYKVLLEELVSEINAVANRTTDLNNHAVFKMQEHLILMWDKYTKEIIKIEKDEASQ